MGIIQEALYIDITKVFGNIDYLQTPSARQKFAGTVNGRIKGEMRITREAPAGPIKPFPFPVTVEWGPEFEKYLGSHSLVEADAPELVAKAREITKAATNTWEAAQATARWVWENTEYDHSYDDLSALGTLKEGKGVCRHFAYLATALCRAVRIPARYIGGYVYDQSSNVFDFHAWVEVYADETGWRAMDPTFGQFDSVDPTHIGLTDSETVLSVTDDLRPGVIKILDYTPREAGPIPPTPLALSSLKICGKELRYGIFVNGKKEGEYTAHLHQANGYFCLREFVDLPPRNTEMCSELLMDEHGFVIEYVNTGLLNYLPMNFRFSFTKEVLKFKTAVGEQKAEGEMSRIFQDEVQVDLLKLVQWGLLAARLVTEVEEVEEETVKTVTVFTGDTPGYFNLTATMSPCGVVYAGSMVDGWFCAISGAQYKTELYLTGDGILTRLDIPENGVKAVLEPSTAL